MSKNVISKLFATQWEAQAIVEYVPTLTLVSMFSISLLLGLGLQVKNAFTEVTECMDVNGEFSSGYTAVVFEPSEGNSQHVMVQYPSTCMDQVTTSEETKMVVELSDNSYLTASLSGDFTGAFDAWCVDYAHSIVPGRTYTTTNYESPENSVDRPENMPLINWMINYSWEDAGFSATDVQGAIWLLIDDKPVRRSHLGSRSVELAQLAIERAGSDSTDPTIRVK